MANILQVTTPNLNTDNRNILNPQDPKYNAANQSVHNPVDPTRVVRADGRDGDQTGKQQDVLFGAVNYESNYGAFIKGLGENGDLSAVMERLLFSDAAGLQQMEKTEVGALVEKLLLAVRMDSPQELVEFMEGQREVQARFTGDFFDSLRSMLAQNPTASLKYAALQFLKGYNDYSSGAHLLQQMRSLTGDIGQLLLRSHREEFQDLVNTMNWQAANGDTAQNTGVLNNRLIPFLASYIASTHDYGPVREAAMLLVFHAVRYQNGEKKGLEKLFDNLINNRTFARLFKGDTQESLEQLLRSGSREVQRPTNGVSRWLEEVHQEQRDPRFREAVGEEINDEVGGRYFSNFREDGEDPWGLGKDPQAMNKDPQALENDPRAFGKDPQALEEDPQAFGKDPQALERDPQAFGKDPQALEKDPQAFGKNPQALDRDPQAFGKGSQALDRDPQAFDKGFQALDRESEALEKDPRALERDFIFSQMGDKELEAELKNAQGFQKESILQEIARRHQTPSRDFADGVASLLLKGAGGQAGLENVQQFYTIMNGMLLNESVYMPLLHFVLPFQYEGNNVMSEMWVDPDAKKDREDGGRAVKLFLKFDIQGLGKFELLMTLQDSESRLQLLVPRQLAKEDKKIQTEVADILKKNGIRYSQLMVRERVRDRRVDEVFPEIREKERTINVRI